MSEHKLKGCRPFETVRLDFTNMCAAYGAAQYRSISIQKDIQGLKERLDELKLELDQAEKQETKPTKEEPKLEVVQ